MKNPGYLRQPVFSLPEQCAIAGAGLLFIALSGIAALALTAVTISADDDRIALSLSYPFSSDPRTLLPALLAMLLAALSTVVLTWWLGTRRLGWRRENHHRMALFQERERAEVILQSIAEAVITFNSAGVVLYLNPVAEQLLQTAVCIARGRTLADVVSLLDENSHEPLPRERAELVQRLHAPQGLLLQLADGQRRLVHHSLSTLRDAGGRDIGQVLVLRDISRERALSDELAFRNSHDDLTGLPNRRSFERHIRKALQPQRHHRRADDEPAPAEQHAVFYVDLDQFKRINDTCGHAAGDRLLQQVAELFAGQLREDDLLARLGGDEFGVLIRRCDDQRAQQLGERLLAALSEYRFHYRDHTFTVGASIGAALLDADSRSYQALMSRLDMACYAAKDLGGNRVYLYRNGDGAIDDKKNEMSWSSRIQTALDNDQFILFWQPIRAMHSGASGPLELREFLLRMRLPNGEMAMPVTFLGAAERYQLMQRLDYWVIDNALKIISQQHRPGDRVVYSINLSGQSIDAAGLADYVIDRLRTHGVEPSLVCFEITETAAIGNLAQAQKMIMALRAAGCSFALDDFGSGLSSFGYLKNLPVDYLKIDGQFVRDLATDRIDAAMIEAIQTIGRVMAIRTIAEGIENETVLQRLRELGVDYGQGYHLGRPAPARSEWRVFQPAVAAANQQGLDLDDALTEPALDTAEVDRYLATAY